MKLCIHARGGFLSPAKKVVIRLDKVFFFPSSSKKAFFPVQILPHFLPLIQDP